MPGNVVGIMPIWTKVIMLNKAFSWNKGYREYFAVKATPNPFILKLLKEEGCGVDCSSLTELMMSECCGFKGSDIMFSSNVTPEEDYKKAYELGAFINLDDFTHIEFLKKLCGIPETIFCRYNPGGTCPWYIETRSDHGHSRRRQVRLHPRADNRGLSRYSKKRAQSSSVFTRFSLQTPFQTATIPSLRAFSLSLPYVCRKRQAYISSSSTFPAA